MTVLLSRFPARVRTSDGSEFNRCAVVAFEAGQAFLAVTVPGGFAVAGGVQVKATLEQPTATVEDGAQVLTGVDGQRWWITAGDGCSCRSPLRTWYQQQLAGQPAGT